MLNRFFPGPPLPPGSPPTALRRHLPVLLKIAPSGVPTSTGPVPLPMVEKGTPDNNINPGEAADSRILWAREIGIKGTDEGTLGRALCMDLNGILWVGMHFTARYYRVDPTTGDMLAPLTGILTPGHLPYGCQVDSKGRLWSVDGAKTLAEIDTTISPYPVTIRNHGVNPDLPPPPPPPAPTPTPRTNYSLSLFNGCGGAPTKVYLSERGQEFTYTAYDPQTSTFSNPPTGVPRFNSVSVGVDSKGNIISGEESSGRIIKTTPGGTLVWDTKAEGSTVSTSDLHGIIIDEHDDVWTVHRLNNRVVKYRGANGDMMKIVPVGNMPYTYGNPPPRAVHALRSKSL